MITMGSMRATLCLVVILFLAALSSPAVVDVNAESSDADNALFDAVSKEDLAAMEAALGDGANINAKSEKGHQTALMQSVLHGKERAVAFLLEKGADA